MKNIIEIEGLNYKYKNINVFDELTLNIIENSFTTIIGSNNSGKTTLVKLLLGLAKGNSIIMCNGLPITKDNLRVLRKETGYIINENAFINETVMDEIAFTLENLNLEKEEIKDKVKKIANKLKITSILEKDPYTLSAEETWLLKLAIALVIEPKILIIDDGFTPLHPKKKKLVLDLLYKLNKKGLTIIITTTNPEETLYATDVIVLKNGKAKSKEKEELLEQNESPFIVSLSEKLKFYDLITQNYLDEEKLVNELWK